MKERFYIHGDRHNEQNNKFYCSFCDCFDTATHFKKCMSLEAHIKKYSFAIDKIKSADLDRKKLIFRPSSSQNYFAKLKIKNEQASRFYKWINKQLDRDDPISDLANDIISDRKFPKSEDSYKSIYSYILTKGACDEALQALYEAFLEFRKGRNSRSEISLKFRFEIFKNSHYKCQICGASAKEEGVRLEVDHKIPLSKGGSNDRDNLWTLCFKCNRGKSISLL